MAKQSLKLPLDPKSLESLGLTPQGFQSRLQILVMRLGERYAQALLARSPLKPQEARAVCRDAAILEAVASLPGLPKVCNRMVDQTKGWVHDAAGEWFQLEVARLCLRLATPPQLEGTVAGVPKDILIEPENTQIECKAFLLPHKIREVAARHVDWFRAIVDAGITGLFDVELPDHAGDLGAAIVSAVTAVVRGSADAGSASVKVTDRSRTSGHFIGPLPPGVSVEMAQIATQWHLPDEVYRPGSVIGNSSGLTVFFSGPPVHLLRHVQSAIEDKLVQLPEEMCNIVALDLTEWYGDLRRLGVELATWFGSTGLRRVSAALLCRREGEPASLTLSTELLENPGALVPVTHHVRAVLAVRSEECRETSN